MHTLGLLNLLLRFTDPIYCPLFWTRTVGCTFPFFPPLFPATIFGGLPKRELPPALRELPPALRELPPALRERDIMLQERTGCLCFCVCFCVFCVLCNYSVVCVVSLCSVVCSVVCVCVCCLIPTPTHYSYSSL